MNGQVPASPGKVALSKAGEWIAGAAIAVILINVFLRLWVDILLSAAVGLVAGLIIYRNVHRWWLSTRPVPYQLPRGQQPYLGAQPQQQPVDGGTHLHIHGMTEEQLRRVLGRGQ